MNTMQPVQAAQLLRRVDAQPAVVAARAEHESARTQYDDIVRALQAPRNERFQIQGDLFREKSEPRLKVAMGVTLAAALGAGVSATMWVGHHLGLSGAALLHPSQMPFLKYTAAAFTFAFSTQLAMVLVVPVVKPLAYLSTDRAMLSVLRRQKEPSRIRMEKAAVQRERCIQQALAQLASQPDPKAIGAGSVTVQPQAVTVNGIELPRRPAYS